MMMKMMKMYPCPLLPSGDECLPCECNNNINPWDQYSCDDITGRCLNCLNNTFGDSCERCAPGYYGDAIMLKDCESKSVISLIYGDVLSTRGLL